MATHTLSPGSLTRAVLEGVPRVECYKGGPRPPEETYFPSCLRAFLEFTGDAREFRKLVGPGDSWHNVYVNVMGASGAAFRLVWDRGKRDPGCTDVFAMAGDPLEPIRRAFEAVGYAHEVVLKDDFAREIGAGITSRPDEARFRDLIADSIRGKGRPVIAFGVFGSADCCLISGYDEGGDVLIGWSHFQDDSACAAGVESEPSGYFRKRDWFADTLGLIVIGDKQARPSLLETHRESLRWTLQVMRTPVVRGRQSGRAAYTAWADALLRDADYPAEDIAVLRERYTSHFLSALVVAEGRWWGAQFLRTIAEAEPAAADDLLDAAERFEAEHDLMWAVWEFAGGNGWSDEQARKLARPGVRRQIVPLIRLARQQNAQAAAHIASALEVLTTGTPARMAGAKDVESAEHIEREMAR